MIQNRIVNNRDLVVEDMLTGWLMAHQSTLEADAGNPRVVKRKITDCHRDG